LPVRRFGACNRRETPGIASTHCVRS
jgi:hypothetical protein